MLIEIQGLFVLVVIPEDFLQFEFMLVFVKFLVLSEDVIVVFECENLMMG